MITKQLLLLIDPEAKHSQLDLDDLCHSLNNHFPSLIDEMNFSTPKRQAAFLAQCAVESMHFQRLAENLNYSASGLRSVFPNYFPDDTLANLYAHQPEKIANFVYANIIGNGNEASGDGWKYKGRGLIQLTGRWSYQHCGDFIKEDLIKRPEYLESVEGAVASAIWFWNFNHLNKYVDKDDFGGLTKIINSAMLAYDLRQKYYQTALEVLSHR
jgi:putative chitinase